MITIEKLKEYRNYHGSWDGYYIQKVRHGLDIVSSDEWSLIENFIQDILLVKRNLASDEYKTLLDEKLKKHCDASDTINEIIKMAEDSQTWFHP